MVLDHIGRKGGTIPRYVSPIYGQVLWDCPPLLRQVQAGGKCCTAEASETSQRAHESLFVVRALRCVFRASSARGHEAMPKMWRSKTRRAFLQTVGHQWASQPLQHLPESRVEHSGVRNVRQKVYAGGGLDSYAMLNTSQYRGPKLSRVPAKLHAALQHGVLLLVGVFRDSHQTGSRPSVGREQTPCIAGVRRIGAIVRLLPRVNVRVSVAGSHRWRRQATKSREGRWRVHDVAQGQQLPARLPSALSQLQHGAAIERRDLPAQNLVRIDHRTVTPAPRKRGYLACVAY